MDLAKQLIDLIIKHSNNNLAAFSRESGISPATINAIKNRGNLPTLEIFQKICKTLNISADELLELPSLNSDSLSDSERELIKVVREYNLNDKSIRILAEMVKSLCDK